MGGPRGYRTPRPLGRPGTEEQLVVAQLRRPSVALWLGLVSRYSPKTTDVNSYVRLVMVRNTCTTSNVRSVYHAHRNPLMTKRKS